jgi:tetratricopeptide (TPR) repeat protein
MTTNKVAGAASTNGIVGRAPARPLGQLWQVPAFFSGFVALVLVAATAPLAPTDTGNQLEAELSTVRRALALPGIPAKDVVTLAENAVFHSSQQPEPTGEAHFLLGAIYLRIAEHSPADRVKEEREKACMQLELALLRGVAPADQARLQYLRGKLLFQSGGDLLRVIDFLSKSLPDGAANPAEGYGILTQAYLKKPVPDIAGALAANQKLMDYCDDDDVLDQARLLRGELLLKEDQRVEAVKVLDQIRPKAPPALRLKARRLQARAATEEGMWAKAIVLWRELLAEPLHVPADGGRNLYYLGHCLYQHEPPSHQQEALKAWQKALECGGEEAQAAAIRLAEVRLFTGNDNEQSAALVDLRRALEKVFRPDDFNNKLIEIHKVRKLLEEACRLFNEKQDANNFLQAAELYGKLAPVGAGDAKIAQAAEAHGRQLLEQGKITEAFKDLQMAALHFIQAAEARPASERADLLWHCIECHLLAKEFPQAIEVLKKFVALPLPPERKAEAWYTLGEMQRLLKQAEAENSYLMCVACNNDDFSSRARLVLAELAIGKLDLAQAEDIYKQIIKGPVADRPAHEEAMWKLPVLLLQQCKYEQAAIKFREMLLAYPAHAQALNARENWGECYRQLASLALKNSVSPEVGEGNKVQYRHRWKEYLRDAVKVYQELIEELDLRAKGKRLAAAEEKLNRKALFVVADCYYELPDSLDDAFVLYQKLWARCAKEADGLWACTKLCSCFYAAVQTGNSKLDLMGEAAADAVEKCLLYFDDFVQAGVFRNDLEKTQWVEHLHKESTALKKWKHNPVDERH